MTRFLLLWIVALALSAVGLPAQAPADFSGSWKMDPSRSDAAAQGPPIGVVTISITQTPAELVIETTEDTSVRTIRYVPAGSTPRPADESVGTFRWDGSQLVTEATIYVNQQAVTLTEARRLNAEGTEMTVDVTLTVQHGYQAGVTSAIRSRTPPNVSTGTNTFVRTRR